MKVNSIGSPLNSLIASRIGSTPFRKLTWPRKSTRSGRELLNEEGYRRQKSLLSGGRSYARGTTLILSAGTPSPRSAARDQDEFTTIRSASAHSRLHSDQ